jgi:hypothetical protein
LAASGPIGPFRIAASGGGLPEISADVGGLTLAKGGGFDATGRVEAAIDIPLAQGAVIEARGRARSRGGVFTFTADDCVGLRAAKVELGENDVEQLTGRFCPAPGGPLIQAGANGYRVQGRFTNTAAVVPFLQARAEAAAGVLDARGGAGGLTAVAVQLQSAEVIDTAPVRRFHPAALSGTAGLSDQVWRADLEILDAPAGTRVAQAALVHQAVSGEGGVDITAQDLRFATEGLQPHDLSPLAAGLVSKGGRGGRLRRPHRLDAGRPANQQRAGCRWTGWRWTARSAGPPGCAARSRYPA